MIPLGAIVLSDDTRGGVEELAGAAVGRRGVDEEDELVTVGGAGDEELLGA